MHDVGSAAALLLAACFAWAGAAKAVAGGVTTAQFAGLGLARPALLARLVPVVELGLAAALVLAPRPAAIAAVGVLAAFSTVLVRAIRGGMRVGCGCFGAARAEPLSGVDLVRNAMLVVCALVAVATPTVDAPSLPAAVIASTASLLGFLTLGVLRLRSTVGSIWAVPTSERP